MRASTRRQSPCSGAPSLTASPKGARHQSLAVAILLLLSGGIAVAAETPSIGRGFALDKIYQFGDVDSVDLQSGALSVAIPIGTSYPVSERLSYSFTLTHSSRVWDYEPATERYWAYPNRRSNSGIGWSFHLGLLIHPSDPANPTGTTQWKYISNEGGEHVFFAALHGTEDDGDTTNSVDYTRDATYLRLKHLGGNPDAQEVEFPDGTIKRFLFQAGSEFQYRLTEIRDRFVTTDLPPQPLNWVRIAYPDTLTWNISDSRGRGHVVKFVSLQYDATAKPMVDYVDLAAFDGTPAHWNFTYGGAGGGSSTIWRDCQDPSPAEFSAPVLASVIRPDGTTWTFVHYNEVPLPPTYSCNQSELADLTFPTGGTIHYDYVTMELPANPPGNCGFPENPDRTYVKVVAVSKRAFTDPVVANPAPLPAVWEYLYSWNSPGFGPVCQGGPDEGLPPEQQVVTVISPQKDETDYFFSVWPLTFTASPSGFVHGEYGLPFTRLQFVGDPPNRRYLSSIAYDCAPAGGTCVEKRHEYVSYEQDLAGVRANRRVQAQRTVYDDDAGTWAEVVSSDFDGVGHYRQTATAGNFGTGDIQTEIRNFNPLRGTYPGSYNVLQIGSPWVLGTFDRVDVIGGVPSDTARKSFSFDPATGFLNSVRTLKAGTTPGAEDIYALFCADTMGNVASELSYGGDGSRLQLPDPLPTCGAVPPASGWQYRMDHTYLYGARATSKYNGASEFTLDQTINLASGLPSSSRDSAGVATNLEYDDLGRLTRSIPQAFGSLPRDARSEYTYWPPASGGPASVEVKRCPAETSCNSGTPLTDDYVEVTGFGRPWHEVRFLPDSPNWAVRVTRYNVMGWKERVSSWLYDADVQFTNENLLAATAYGGYDAFGRPATVTQPDSTTTTFHYAGVRTVQTDQSLALTLGGADQCVRRQERFDRQGRLDRVDEAYTDCTVAGVPTMATEYSFDEAGRLAKVCQNVVGTTCGQQRLFSFDNRGFLISEQHPEKGSAGLGTVSYSCYDAAGHARYRDDGATTGRRLAYSYDASARLTKVRVPANTETCIDGTESGTTWKQFSFATTNVGSQASKGKLASATGRNELGAPAFPASSVASVTESYTYQERGGRVSKRSTAVSGAGVASETWEVAQTYEPLGQVATQNYPVCTAGAGCTGAPAARSLAMTYGNGMLRTITGSDSAVWLTNLVYHASGMPSIVTHGGGLVETIAQAGNGMARPASISIASPNEPTPFSTGTYAYDGAGDIKSMGSDLFRYDKFQRLAEATMGSLGAGIAQSTTFDVYGNITATTTNGTGENFPTTAATNHLTSAAYDASGNTTLWNGNTYVWDRLNRMTRWSTASEGWSYVYTAGDERLWAIRDDANATHSTWTIRGLGNEVLTRDERIPASAFSEGYGRAPGDCVPRPPLVGIFCDGFEGGSTSVWSSATQVAARTLTDYVYRQGKLLGARTIGGATRDFGLDHLGSVRVSANYGGPFTARHTYFPFGREATSTGQDAEVMKFAGHERDLQSSPANPSDDLDYMHARSRSPLTGRFLSVDPSGVKDRFKPQAWNKYAYVLGNPLRFVDPNGADEREGIWAGVIVNSSSRPIWIAGDIGRQRPAVIPLMPGESSAEFFRDVDVIVVESGSDAPTIDQASDGAFKVGFGKAVVADDPSNAQNLTLSRSIGYGLSFLGGRAGHQDRTFSQSQGWTVSPTSRQEAESLRKELKKTQEKREKRREAEDEEVDKLRRQIP